MRSAPFPAPAPRTSPQPSASGRPATHPGRRRSVAPPGPRRPCAARLALAPTPRGNLKHGAPNGGFRQMDRETTREPSRPFRGGFPGGAPRAGGGRSSSERRPGRCCSAAAGGAARPRARGRAHRLGPAGVPGAGGRDPGAGSVGSGLRRPGGAGATRQGRSRARFAPGPRLTLRTSPAGDPAETPAPAGRKVTLAGQEPGARRRGDGSAHVLRAVRRRRGRGEEAADAGCSRGSPPPFAGDSEARRSCAGAHAQRARTAHRPPPHPDSGCGGGGRRSTSGQLLASHLLVLAWGQRLDTAANSVSHWVSTSMIARALYPLLSPPTRRL